MHRPLHQSRLQRIRRALADESGVALVEFALVLPLLALILFGALDFGKAYNYWIDTTQLASEGARAAAVNQADFLTTVHNQANTAELKNGGTNSVPNALRVCVYLPDGSTVGEPVRVEVTSTYRFMSFIAGKLNLLEKQMVADSTMRLERQPTYADGDCA